MWSNLRYILQEETTVFTDELDIEDDGKEGINEGSFIYGLNNAWTEFLFTQGERWTDLGE